MRSLTCRRCGRRLKSEISREKGYGPDCFKKMMEEKKHADEKIELLDLEKEKVKEE